MLTVPEKILFALATILTAVLAYGAVLRLVRIIGRGTGRPDWSVVPRRLAGVAAKTITLWPVFRARPIPSLLHAFVVWGFPYYLLVNISDVLRGYLPEFHILGRGSLGGLYRLGADLLSVAVLAGGGGAPPPRGLPRPPAPPSPAPLNLLPKPGRRSMGQLDPLDFEDQSVDQFGVARLEDLPWGGLMDAYACIMCNRCQDACPAYATGKVLSPAALEINKRYFLNQEGSRIAA